MNAHTIHLVRKFHETFGHPVAGSPTVATKELRELRVKLIAEELVELCQASGVALEISVSADDPALFSAHAYGDDKDVDLIEVADALGDLDYVVQGANLVFGLPAEAIINEIQRSNMSKLGEDGKPVVRADGKILKGPDYSPPDVRGILIQSYIETQK